jgi:hypothetical protein
LASAETLPDKKQEYYQRSVDYGIKSIEIAEEIGELPGINFAAKTLRKAYKGLGMYDKAFKYAEIYITTQDSMFNEDKINAIQEMETRYQTEKKEQQIKLQETELAKSIYSTNLLLTQYQLLQQASQSYLIYQTNSYSPPFPSRLAPFNI